MGRAQPFTTCPTAQAAVNWGQELQLSLTGWHSGGASTGVRCARAEGGRFGQNTDTRQSRTRTRAATGLLTEKRVSGGSSPLYSVTWSIRGSGRNGSFLSGVTLGRKKGHPCHGTRLGLLAGCCLATHGLVAAAACALALLPSTVSQKPAVQLCTRAWLPPAWATTGLGRGETWGSTAVGLKLSGQDSPVVSAAPR